MRLLMPAPLSSAFFDGHRRASVALGEPILFEAATVGHAASDAEDAAVNRNELWFLAGDPSLHSLRVMEERVDLRFIQQVVRVVRR